MRKACFLFSLIAILLSSCTNLHFEEKIRFENNNWIKFNDLNIKIPVEAGKSYSFSGNIITDSTYTNNHQNSGL